mmetsp:Transcript_93982/g.223668  ORF Transcript_93982/g.223668 Transcript_93982/m.223668 type:complete len:218 (-) Transcript_93982:564-1217(-)
MMFSVLALWRPRSLWWLGRVQDSASSLSSGSSSGTCTRGAGSTDWERLPTSEGYCGLDLDLAREGAVPGTLGCMLLPANVDSAMCIAFTRSVLNSSGTFPYLEIHMKMLAIRHEHTTRMLKLTFFANSPVCTSQGATCAAAKSMRSTARASVAAGMVPGRRSSSQVSLQTSGPKRLRSLSCWKEFTRTPIICRPQALLKGALACQLPPKPKKSRIPT